MSARRLISAVVVATAAFGLAACQPDGSPDSSPTTAAAGAPSGSAHASASASAGRTAKPSKAAPTADSSSSQAADDDPGMTCTEPKLAAGHKVVMPTARPMKDTLFAKPVTFVCDPNDGHYEGTGAEKSYLFAKDVKAQLATDAAALKTVIVGDLWTHIGDCLDGGADVKPPFTCSAFPAYDIALDSSGKITSITEIWHS